MKLISLQERIATKITPGALANEGLKVRWYGSLTKDAWNLVRRMTKQRFGVARVWLKIASLAENRSKAGLGIKPSSISNLGKDIVLYTGIYS